MFSKVLLVCAAGLSLLAGAYALTSSEPRADFSYVNSYGIHTLDPARMSWTNDFRIALNIWEGLTSWDPRTMEPIGAAAEFPPEVSADGLTYTFTIRSDARWSNGDPVTPRDFVRGWRRGLEPGTATDYTFLIADNVVGAADYVSWRRDAVAALTTLSRLRDGWDVDADQARALSKQPYLGEVQTAFDEVRDPSEPLDPSTDGEPLARRLNDADLDFERLYANAYAAHVAALDRKFAEVGIEASGDGTLTVRLANPCPFFLDLTGFPVFLPCHQSVDLLRLSAAGSPITEEGLVVYDPQWTKPDYRREGYPGLVTNGPYRLASWTFKRRARLTVNPHHRLASDITCRTVDMLVYENISASIMAYEAGDVEFLPGMNVPYEHEIARLAQTGERPDFHLCTVLATYFFNFNCADQTVQGRPNPFVDARVRRAFALAVDREAVVNNVLMRGDRVATSFVPPDSIPGYDPPDGLRHDDDEARRLIADAGFPNGTGLPAIELLYTPNDERVCQAVARMWEDTLGARVELRCKESKTFAEDKANRAYMIARANWYADYGDPTTFLDCLTTGNGNNDSGYANPAYDDLLTEARLTRDPAARAGLLRRAEAILVEQDLPILPMLHYVSPIAIKPYVKGVYPNPRLWFPFRFIEVTR